MSHAGKWHKIMTTKERNEIIFEAKRNTFLYFATGRWYAHRNLRVFRNRYDMRTVYGRTAAEEEKRLANNSEMVELSRMAYDKRNERARARHAESEDIPTANILANKLYNDFRKNYYQCSAIYRDHLNFYGRNHWAKNRQDLNVLEVLRRHHPEMAK